MLTLARRTLIALSAPCLAAVLWLLIWWALAPAATVGAAAGAGPALAVAAAPLAYWSFDDGTNPTADLTGNGHAGDLVNGPTFTTLRPITLTSGNALNFDGTADYVLVGGNEADFDLSVVSVAFWVKVEAFTTAWQALVTKGDSAWRVHRAGSTNQLGFGTTGLSNVDLTSNRSLNDGQWHHIAAVYDGSAKYIYIDGALDISTTVTGGLATNNYAVRLGDNEQVPGRFFYGQMDDVRIYGVALTASEVAALAAGGQAGLSCFAEYNGDGVTDFASQDAGALRAALAAAMPGATVKVAGTCAGVATENSTTQVALVTQTLTLVGGYTTTNWTTAYPLTQPTTLDAQGGGRVLFITTDATVQGLTLTNGYLSTTLTAENGGGLYAAGALTLTDMVIYSNTVTGTVTTKSGGGAYIAGAATVVNTVFQSNTVRTQGGGAYVGGTAQISTTTFLSNSARFEGGGAFFNAAANVTNSTLTGNTSMFSNGGGALFNNVASVTNSVFAANTAGTNGGGLRANAATQALTLTNVTFLSNTAVSAAGGASLNGFNTVVNGGRFENNRCTNCGTAGGGAIFVGRLFTLTSVSFISNSATGPGGAVAVDIGQSVNPDGYVVNSLFARNTSGAGRGMALAAETTGTLQLLYVTVATPTLASGSAIYLSALSAGGLTNTLFANHAVALETFTGTVRENYNLFAGVTTPYSGAVTAGGNSLTGTAGFVNAAADNYRLTNMSAARDAGTDVGVTTDLDGAARPLGLGYDIGAYEYVPPHACYATPDNGTTVFSSYDAQAVRDAINAAPGGGNVKVAGTCAGVSGGQVALITQTLTLAGGYASTDWTQAYPLTQPTTLDAQGAGRVLSVTAAATLQGFTLTNGIATNSPGGGLYAAQAITLTGLTFYSNTVTGTTGTREGGGAYLAAGGAISATQFFTNTAYGAGGGASLKAASALTNTSFVGNRSTNSEGGGLRVQTTGSVVASDLNFYSNQALGGGGGAASWDAPGRLLNSQVASNTANNTGGGIYFNTTANVSGTTFLSNTANGRGGGAFFNATSAVTSVTFVANTALGANQGGGAYLVGSAQISATTFSTNSASGNGGGAYFGSTSNITNSTFSTNTSGSNGGGVYFNGTTANFNRSTFSANTASTSGGGAFFFNSAQLTGTTFSQNRAAQGGGVWFDWTTAVTNTVFSRNTATQGGGAYVGATTSNARQFTNVLFAANTATSTVGMALYHSTNSPLTLRHVTVATPTLTSGSAIYNGGSATVNIQNTLVANHAVGLERAAGTVNENYNLFAGVTVPYSGTVVSGGNSLTGTAGFVNAAADNYRLTNTSAAVNAGTNLSVNYDLDSVARPQFGAYDIGAYEYVAPSGVCYATPDDGTTLFSSNDAQAVRDAVNAAPAGGSVKVAGTCAGVSGGQVAAITKTLTLAGGYTVTNWSTAYPLTRPTTLDAQGAGRVLSVTAAATLQGFTLTNGVATNSPGGGLYTAQPITLTSLTFYSNTVTGTTGVREGGGAYLAAGGAISATAFLTNTAYDAGGGAALKAASALTNTMFVGNRTTNSEAGGLRVQTTGNVVATGLSFYNNQALGGGGGAASWDAPGQLLNSQVVSNSASNLGGGIYFNLAANVSGTTFISNTANNGRGGGVVFNNTGAVTHVTFISNTALGINDGGGAYFNNAAQVLSATFSANRSTLSGGGAYFANSAQVLNATFSTNSATSNGGGGFFASTTQLTNTLFSANSTSSMGGGAYFFGSAQVLSATFSANSAITNAGGGFFVSTAQLTGTLFSANTTSGNGGGAYFNGGVATVTNTLFSRNVATQGGGVFLSLNNPTARRQFTNVLFVANTATSTLGLALYHNTTSPLSLQHVTVVTPTLTSGVALYITGSVAAGITNTLIASHTVGLARGSGTVNENYNLFSGVTTPYSGTIISGGNSLTGTAGFVDALADNYRITSLSAAKDAGTNLGITYDLVGEARPQDSGYDIGAYEFSSVKLCYATANDGLTVFSDNNANPVRVALATAAAGSTVKLAGTCAGVSGGQVAAITQPLTLAGGYTATNWTQSYPLTQPTTLDALGAGRGLSLTAAATLRDFTLTNGYANDGAPGGGLYTQQPLTLTGMTFYSNVVTGTALAGGGAYVGGVAHLSSTQFLTNTASGVGGGAAFAAASTLTNTTFSGNQAPNGDGGGAWFNQAATLTGGVFQQNTAGSNKSGGGAYFGQLAAISGTQFLTNTFGSLSGSATCGTNATCGGGLYANAALTLTNATLRGNSARLGGGAYFASTATVTSTAFTSNTATNIGGGARFISDATVVATVFQSNTALSAGGASFVASAVVNNSVFLGNQASGTNGGGANFNDTATVVGSVFQNNRAAANSGGAFFNAQTYLTGTTFLSNTAATGAGGGARFFGAANIASSFFMSNTAASGGGLSFEAAQTHQVVNTLLVNNQAPVGMAIYVANASPLQLQHLTLASPTSLVGSAIRINGGTVALTNTLIASHTVGIEALGGTVNENYNLFSGVTTPYTGTVLSGGNSLTGTASFVNAAANNYHLTGASAARDAGTNLGVTTDLEGVVRPQGNGYDIGAYEYIPTAPVANADAYTGTEDVTLTVLAAAGVLANDAADGAALSASLVTAPSAGSLALAADGAFTYTPALNTNGTYTFTYIAATSFPAAFTYWNFDAGTNPTVDGRGVYTGALLNGAAFTSNVPLTTGLAAQFDGVDDQVVITGPLTSLANRSFTVAFWAQRTSSGTVDHVVGHGSSGVTNQNLHIGFRNTNVFTCAFWSDDLDTTATYTDAAWHHWACTYDAATNERRIYRDGVFVISGTASADYQGSGPLYIGARAPGSDNFAGAVDDVQLYESALSASEVQSVMNAGPALGTTANVTLTIAPVNDTPVAVDDVYTTTQGTVVTSGQISNGLATLAASGNFAQSGNMFNVTAGTAAIPLTGMDINIQGTAANQIAVYYKAGTYVGFEQTPAAWTLLGTLTVTGQDPNTSLVDLTALGGLTIPAGQTYALYVTSVSGFLRYEQGANVYTNGSLTLTTGTGNVYPFGTVFTPRTWAGRLYYQTPGGVLLNDFDVESILTATLSTSPSNGALSFNSDGTFAYTPTANFTGVDTFNYIASDGALTDTATVTITVVPAACLVETTGDNVTDYASADATALQNAVNVASVGALLKVAGTCSGVHAQGGVTQTVYVSQSLTLQGGYTYTNWLATSEAATHTTTLNANGLGRVVYVPAGYTVTVERLHLTGGASTGNGGGLYNAGTLHLSASTLYTNTAAQGGALFANTGATTHITNSTFAYNSASMGGGLYSDGALTITNSTLAYNTATELGGGLFNEDGALALYNTLMAYNVGNNTCHTLNPIIVSVNSLITDGTCNALLTADPLLDPLANNGGATWTFALRSGSPAIEAGNNATCAATDQRGLTRPQGAACDIGAYEAMVYTLTVTTAGTGSGVVTPTVGVHTYTVGTVVTLTAAPNAGSVFTDWGGNCAGVGTNPCVLTMNSAQTATAIFTLNTYTLAVATAGTGSGVVTPTAGIYTYTAGTVVTLTAAPNLGSTFAGWSGACSGTGSCVVTMNSAQSVTATFTLNTYTLTVATAGTGSGVVTPTAGIYTYTYGTVVTLTASANTGSTFIGWSGDCSGTGSCVVTINGAQSVSATFTLNTYTLTVATAGTGSGVVTPTAGIYTYTYGTVVTLTASANLGSTFGGWSGACSGTGSCVVTMNNAQSVTAMFVEYKQYLPFIRR